MQNSEQKNTSQKSTIILIYIFLYRVFYVEFCIVILENPFPLRDFPRKGKKKEKFFNMAKKETKKRLTKSEMADKKELAKLLYMQGETQKVISERIGISEITVSGWAKKEAWAEKKAGTNITRPELVNKLLLEIDNLITSVSKSDDITQKSKLPDSLSKFASVIEKLDKKANIVDTIDVFIAFNKWLQFRNIQNDEIIINTTNKINEYLETRKSVSVQFVASEFSKMINRFQDLYISEHINKG